MYKQYLARPHSVSSYRTISCDCSSFPPPASTVTDAHRATHRTRSTHRHIAQPVGQASHQVICRVAPGPTCSPSHYVFSSDKLDALALISNGFDRTALADSAYATDDSTLVISWLTSHMTGTVKGFCTALCSGGIHGRQDAWGGHSARTRRARYVNSRDRETAAHGPPDSEG